MNLVVFFLAFAVNGARGFLPRLPITKNQNCYASGVTNDGKSALYRERSFDLFRLHAKSANATSGTTRKKWREVYPKLLEFYNQHGNSDPTDDEDAELSKWVRMIRNNYSWQKMGRNPTFSSGKPRPKLSDDKLKQLDEIEFQWKSNHRKSHSTLSWDARYLKLREFYEEHGHSSPSNAEDPELWRWARQERAKYSWQVRNESPLFPNGKPRPRLSDVKLKKLDDIEFRWAVNYGTWRTMYPKLLAFYEEHGHSNPTFDDDVELSWWVQDCLRHKYVWQIEGGDPLTSGGKPRRKLSDDKVAKLSAIDFQWRLGVHSPLWDKMYPLLCKFYETHGHSNPSDDEDPELARWIQHMQTRYSWKIKGDNPRYSTGNRRQALSDEKMRALDQINFKWY